MSASQAQARFFGLDLSVLRRDLLAAWRGMLAWPLLAWLWPKLPLRLCLPTGVVVLSHGPGTTQLHDPRRIRAARFEAVQLPEHLLLRRSLKLPQLQSYELQSALALQASNLSPFPPSDLVWAYQVGLPHIDQGEGLAVHLVISSRKLVAQYVVQTHPAVSLDKAEVWVTSAVDQHDLVLPGFGEAARARRALAWRWVSIVLLLVILALVAAMALTPSIQLYMRTQQAHLAMASLQPKAAPVLKQRESLVYATEQLSSLAELTGKTLPPLQILKIITDALPDDTSLLRLEVQGLKVTMSGQTVNAAALMKQLGATPGLRDVTAPAPATKPLGAPREQFTIEFTLDSVQLPPAK